MCGILVTPVPVKTTHIKHRGPDSSVHKKVGKYNMFFHRLEINGGKSPINQPFGNMDKYLVCNGEIYNYLELKGKVDHSDCEVILPNINTNGLFKTCQMLDGDFAFVYTDGNNIWAARDPVGVRPLFYTRGKDGISFASEAKALIELETRIEIFPPGHLYDSRTDKFHQWYTNYWDKASSEYRRLSDILYMSVFKRVNNTERPVGFFLSGGLDSSIIAAIGNQLLPGPIRTFSIGLENSPDIVAARAMARHINSNHTEVTFTVQEGIEALREVIWHLETHDKTTIRAAVPMFLLSKYIKENTDIKVILSGEGSDELFGGYLYMQGAPSHSDFQMESVRLVNDVHMFDVLRADRTTAAHGLELRVPFFDKQVIQFAMEYMSPYAKYPQEGIEKMYLRNTFEHLLPPEIAWRQKNGMSDAVGTQWVDSLKNHDEPYKKIFIELFGEDNLHLTPYQWMPKWTDATDPSARYLKYYKE